MNLPSILLLVSGALNFAMGFAILWRNLSRRANLYFALMAISTSAWSFCLYFFRLAITSETILHYGRWAFVFSAATTYFFYLFSIYFPEDLKKNKLIKIIPASLAFLLVFYLSVNGNILIASGVKISGVSALTYNDGVVIFGAYTMILFGISIRVLIKKYKKYTGVVRLQLKYVLTGSILSVSAALFFSFVLTYYHIFAYNWVGPTATIALVGLVFYTIIKYRLMDVRFVAAKIYFHFFAIFAFYFSFFFLHYLSAGIEVFRNNYWAVQAIVFCAATLFSFSILPFINYVQRTSDMLFFKGNNPREMLKDLSVDLNGVLTIDSLLAVLMNKIKNIHEVNEVRVVVFTKSGKNVLEDKCVGNCLRIKNESSLYGISRLIVRDEIADNKRLVSELDRYGVKIVAPLRVRNEVLGLIMLGEKKSKSGYTKQDIDFLNIVSFQAAIAIENARLYRLVEDFNKTLKRKVDDQTRDLKHKAERLQKLIEMRSEFLDVASHQLRTPISVIKGMLSMMEEGSVPKEKKSEFIDSAFKKALKLEEIIDEILCASEMDTGKFELNLVAADIAPMILEVCEDKKIVAKQKGLKFECKLPKRRLPFVYTDRRYLRNVISNIINNAIHYTVRGGVVVDVKVRQKMIIIRVTDTGIGIHKCDIEKLFKKFSRGINAKNTYTDGSGLGLFIARKIIEAHPGASINIVKTVVDKGAVFEIALPAVK